MELKPKVSVIMPAYNVAGYISKSIESVLNQTLTDFELIVVNDGSTDDTESVITKYLKDKRIIYVNQKNLGLSGARNSGLKRANGEFLFFLDGDDYLENNTLQTFYELAQKSNCEIIISNIVGTKGLKRNLKNNRDIDLSNDLLKSILDGTIVGSVCNKFYSHSFWKDNNFQFSEDVAIGEDLIASVQIFYCAKKVKYIDQDFLHYIKRETSLINTYNSNMLDIFNVIEHIRLFLCKKNVMEQYIEEFEYLEFLHTYFYRLMNGVQNATIQKQIYDRAIVTLRKNIQNPYIKEHIRSLSLNSRNTFWLFYASFYLGRLKMILLGYIKGIFDKLP